MYQGCFVTSLSCSHHHCHPFLYLTANRMHETNHTFLGTETGVISIALPSQSCMAWGDATRGSTLWLTWVGISHHSLHLSGHIISVVPMLLHNTSPRASCRSLGLQYTVCFFLQSILWVVDPTHSSSIRMVNVTYNTSSFPSPSTHYPPSSNWVLNVLAHLW